jgi:hypothetical protein
LKWSWPNRSAYRIPNRPFFPQDSIAVWVE